MRAANLQELVYKQGSAGITKATVSIVFHNNDPANGPSGYEDKEYITVTRQVRRCSALCAVLAAATVPAAPVAAAAPAANVCTSQPVKVPAAAVAAAELPPWEQQRSGREVQHANIAAHIHGHSMLCHEQ